MPFGIPEPQAIPTKPFEEVPGAVRLPIFELPPDVKVNDLIEEIKKTNTEKPSAVSLAVKKENS